MMLICALEQVLQVAPRFKENTNLFEPTGTAHEYLVRVNNNGRWEDAAQHVTFHEEKVIDILMDEEALEHLRTLMPGTLTLEIDLYMMDKPVQEKQRRDRFPFMLMLVTTKAA
jgi:hypothetical protein